MAIVIETKLLQVYIDGRVFCVTSFGGTDTLIVSENRDLNFGPYQSQTGLVDLDDFRWYNRSLSSTQVCGAACLCVHSRHFA